MLRFAGALSGGIWRGLSAPLCFATCVPHACRGARSMYARLDAVRCLSWWLRRAGCVLLDSIWGLFWFSAGVQLQLSSPRCKSHAVINLVFAIKLPPCLMVVCYNKDRAVSPAQLVRGLMPPCLMVVCV